MEQRFLQIPEQNISYRQLRSIAPVLEHVSSGERTGGDIWQTIESLIEQGRIPFILLRGESGSGKGQLQREINALIVQRFPNTQNITSSLAGKASELEKKGIVPNEWESWTPEHFQFAEQGMIEDIERFYQLHRDDETPVAILNETILPFPGFPIGNGVIEKVVELAHLDSRIAPVIILPITEEDIWQKTYAVRTQIGLAQTSEELQAIWHEAGIKPVDERRRRSRRRYNPQEVFKESGNPEAMLRTRGIMNSVLLANYQQLRQYTDANLPENIEEGDLDNPILRELLVEAYEQQLAASWYIPGSPDIFIVKNPKLEKTVPLHEDLYRRFSGHS